ncbi:hypothetical protein EV363DRAFT_1426886 [Boletus edulis]|nr:hypothetical protein EV363DRAFT_1426886 [Boletus edulis]
MSETILLCPRPLARYGGRFVLLPLLPERLPLKPLPAEIWSRIFTLALSADVLSWCVSLMLVCKSFREVASPLLYSNVKPYTVSGLDKFTLQLHTADQLWDSIRRIPYSTPGRWVQTLNLSGIATTQAFAIDSLLTTLFPLMPFMESMTLPPSLPLSRRALASLTNRDGASNLRILNGICYIAAQDPIVRLLRTCHQLERLEVIGSGMEPADTELDSQEADEIPAATAKLVLPRLHTLTLLSLPLSTLMHALLNAALPRLRALYLTPYDDVPFPRALTTQFLDIHGTSLSTLSLFTPKSWPTHFHPSPCTLFHTCPNLRHLSLETPLPALVPPDAAESGEALPLQILSIPRPNPEFWRSLETLLPLLPSLNVIRMRDVRWLRRGLNHHAQEAGVQGEMRVWRQRLAKRGICLVDGDWKDMA